MFQELTNLNFPMLLNIHTPSQNDIASNNNLSITSTLLLGSDNPNHQTSLESIMKKLNKPSNKSSLAWCFFDKPEDYKLKISCKVN